jgi:hypothetical protein
MVPLRRSGQAPGLEEKSRNSPGLRFVPWKTSHVRFLPHDSYENISRPSVHRASLNVGADEFTSMAGTALGNPQARTGHEEIPRHGRAGPGAGQRANATG